MIKLAADENFNNDIVRGLLRRKPELDLVRVQDTDVAGADDPVTLEWAAQEGRVLLTHDVSTITRYAYERVQAGLPMPGVFEVRRAVPIGRAIEDILLLAECSLEGEWEGQVRYPVAVIRSPAGEARETLRFPFDELALDNRLKDLQIALLRSGGKRRQMLSPEERAVQEFGRTLFDSLVVGKVRSRYGVSQREAARQGKGLRFKLRIQSPELAALPWEFLYDSRQAKYVCLSRNTPVVRYLELPQPIPPLTVTPPPRIMGMIASPSDPPPTWMEPQELSASAA